MKTINWSDATPGYPIWIQALNGGKSGWHCDDGDRYTSPTGSFWTKPEEGFYAVHLRPEWSGEGLPPVGAICELRRVDGGWGRAIINYMSNTTCVWLWDNGNPDQREWACEPWKMEFRAVPTQKQLEEAARQRCIMRMQNDASCHSNKDIFEKLYDAGYRKPE